MKKHVSFDVLLEAAGATDLHTLDEELHRLQQREEVLQRELCQLQDTIHQLSEERAVPIRAAVKMADEMGIGVPPAYRNVRKTPGNRKPTKRYEWRSPGCMTKKEAVSTAMWRLSRGSGGRAGKEGVLSSSEFWELVKEELGKNEHDIAKGEELTLELPNGRAVTFVRID